MKQETIFTKSVRLAGSSPEEFGKAEERALRHWTEGLEHLLLHVERVHPERDAALEVAHVGVDGAAVPDVVGRVRVGRPEDALAHKQGLN